MPVDFSGTWELEKLENVDKYLDSLGITEETKAQLKARKLTCVVKHKGNDFTMFNDLGIETEGKIGEEYEQLTGSGIKLKNFATWDGDKLVVKTTSAMHEGIEHITVRELKDDKIIQTNQVNGGPAAFITLKRVKEEKEIVKEEKEIVKEEKEILKEEKEILKEEKEIVKEEKEIVKQEKKIVKEGKGNCYQ